VDIKNIKREDKSDMLERGRAMVHHICTVNISWQEAQAPISSTSQLISQRRLCQHLHQITTFAQFAKHIPQFDRHNTRRRLRYFNTHNTTFARPLCRSSSVANPKSLRSRRLLRQRQRLTWSPTCTHGMPNRIYPPSLARLDFPTTTPFPAFAQRI
jgi:hypothetical protein